MTKKTLVIFGGADPEEAAARTVAKKNGCLTATATVKGNMVHAGNAYKADSFVLDGGKPSETNNVNVVIFECSREAAGELKIVKICDHHKEGDFGYSLGPELFFEASSLGQLCKFLGVKRTPELELIAAGDHCPVQAYLGNCPGINKANFLDFRVRGKAKYENKKYEEIHKDFQEAKRILLASPEVKKGLFDVRGHGRVPEIAEAAMSLGVAFLASFPEIDRERRKTGKLKIIIQGNASPEYILDFMKWGNSLPNKIGDAYGNPTRGYAGVIVKG